MGVSVANLISIALMLVVFASRSPPFPGRSVVMGEVRLPIRCRS
jgi:hypothetical protein